MPIGPGKYDQECTQIRETTHARGAIVIVFGGDRGDGFSMQASIEDTLQIHKTLRRVADQIEESLRDKGIIP